MESSHSDDLEYSNDFEDSENASFTEFEKDINNGFNSLVKPSVHKENKLKSLSNFLLNKTKKNLNMKELDNCQFITSISKKLKYYINNDEMNDFWKFINEIYKIGLSGEDNQQNYDLLMKPNEVSGIYLDIDICIKKMDYEDKFKDQYNLKKLSEDYAENYIKEVLSIVEFNNNDKLEYYIFLRPDKEIIIKDECAYYKTGSHIYIPGLKITKKIKNDAYNSLINKFENEDLIDSYCSCFITDMNSDEDYISYNNVFDNCSSKNYIIPFGSKNQNRIPYTFKEKVSITVKKIKNKIIIINPKYSNKEIEKIEEIDLNYSKNTLSVEYDDRYNDDKIENLNSEVYKYLNYNLTTENLCTKYTRINKLVLALGLLDENFIDNHDNRFKTFCSIYHECVLISEDEKGGITKIIENSIAIGWYFYERMQNIAGYNFKGINYVKDNIEQISKNYDSKNNKLSLSSVIYHLSDENKKKLNLNAKDFIRECILDDLGRTEITVKTIADYIFNQCYDYVRCIKNRKNDTRWYLYNTNFITNIGSHRNKWVYCGNSSNDFIISKFIDRFRKILLIIKKKYETDRKKSDEKKISKLENKVNNTLIKIDNGLYTNKLDDTLTTLFLYEEPQFGIRLKNVYMERPDIKGVLNGIIVSDMNGEIKFINEPNPLLYVSQSMNAEYKHFDEFNEKEKEAYKDLKEMFDLIFNEYNDVKDFLMMTFASSLRSDLGGKKLYLLKGAGADGKSTIVNIVSKTFGADFGDTLNKVGICSGYARTVKPSIYTGCNKNANSHDASLANIENVDIIFSSEPSQKDNSISPEALKTIFKGEEIRIRKPYEGEESVKLRATGYMCTNVNHIIGANDYGALRRICLIEFYNRFLDKAHFEEGEKFYHRANPKYEQIANKLEYRNAMLYILTEYYKMLYNKTAKITKKNIDVGDLDIPEDIRKQTEMLYFRSNTIGIFIKSIMEECEGSEIQMVDLYKRYMKWFEEEHVDGKHKSIYDFESSLSENKLGSHIIGNASWNKVIKGYKIRDC